jgi:hypothetical protein
MVARTTGRDKFLDEQVAMHLNNSFVKFLENLKKGKDDVMNLSGNNPTLFFRHDIGKPKRLINVNFQNGPISVYHWRDPTIERYIYYQLQQSDMDIVRTFGNQSYQLEVIWSKYPRQQQLNLNSPLREYGLSADFRILEKDKEQEDKLVFEKTILSEILPGEIYGIQPIEVMAQWRKIFDNSYIVGDIVRRLQSPPINFDLDKTSESDNW